MFIYCFYCNLKRKSLCREKKLTAKDFQNQQKIIWAGNYLFKVGNKSTR